MKLKVYQQGGGLIYTPFIPERTQSTLSGGSKTGSGEDDPKIDPLDKEILALMKDQNLLPSDIQAIYNSLTAFQRRTQHLSGLGGTGAYRSVMPGMLSIMQMVSTARANKDFWDKKSDEMRKHDAGSEMALDSYGRMWVQDTETGKLSRINPADFDVQKHKPISNSELLYLRHREYGFADSMIDDTGMDVIGMKDVRDEILDNIEKLGKISTRSAEAQLIKDIAGEAQKVYMRHDLEYSKAKGHEKEFASVIYNGLSNDAKNLLRARQAIGEADPVSWIATTIFMNTDETDKPDVDIDLTKISNGGGAGGSGEKLNDHDTFPERLSAGQGVVAHWDFIMPGNSGNKLWAYVQDYGVPGDGKKALPTSSLKEVYEHFEASQMLDWSNATIGDQPITTVDFPKIMYRGGTSIKRVVLPVRPDGKIDFKTQQEVATLKNWIDEEGILNETLIKERVSEIDGAYWDSESKTIKFKRFKPFVVMDVVTSSDKVRIDPNSPYVYNMDKGPADIRKDWLNTYEDVLTNGYEGKSKDNKFDFGKTRGRHLYEGVLFIPLISSSLAATIYHDQNVPKSRYEDVRTDAEANERANREIIGNYGE